MQKNQDRFYGQGGKFVKTKPHRILVCGIIIATDVFINYLKYIWDDALSLTCS